MRKFTDIIFNQVGTPVPSATVTVRVANASPGTGALATIYSDDGTTTIPSSTVTTDTTGRFSFYAADGRYDFTVTGTGITTTTVGDLGEGGIVLNAKILNSVRYADQYATGSTTGGIQEAVTDCPDGGTVFLAAGTYAITSTITITKRITIQGCGWGSLLQVGSGVGASTDIFLLKPPTSSAVQGMRLQDFYISPASGTPARYGINIDGTNGSVSNLVIDHVRIDTLGNYGIAITNASGLTEGTPFTTTIRDSVIAGGLNLTKLGDSVNLQNNVFTGVRDVIIDQVNGASDGGAHGFLMLNNNITVNGGTIVKNAWQGTIAFNNFEQVATSTNANSALLEIQGNASANVEGLKIVGNYIGANSLYVNDSVRIHQATATDISNNYVVRSSTGVAYRITANAINTDIGFNRQAPAGEAIGTWLADLGTNTHVRYRNKDTGILTFSPIVAFSSLGGTTGCAISSAQLKVGSGGVLGASSGADASTSGLDTGLSRISAGLWAVGNGSGADFSGSMKATGFTAVGQITSSIVTGTAPLVVASTTPVANLSLSGGSGSTVTTNTLSVASGVTAAGGMKHQRLTFNAPNGISAQTLTWTATFTNQSYTVACSIVGGGSGDLSVVNVSSLTSSSITVQINNTSGGTLNGCVLHAIAMHD